MANRLVDDAYKHVRTVMDNAKKELSNIQSEPIGREARSKKEIGIIMEKMNSLPEEERNVRMDEMITLSGHKGPGLDDCGMCEMIKSQSK